MRAFRIVEFKKLFGFSNNIFFKKEMLQDIHRMKEVGNGPLTLKDRKGVFEFNEGITE